LIVGQRKNRKHTDEQKKEEIKNYPFF